MRDRGDKSAREAAAFATAHDLTFYADQAPDLPSAFPLQPFAGMRRRQCVSGQWRGRTVQRFRADEVTVELVALPRPLPRVQVVAVGTSRGVMDVGGFPVPMGDPAFDAALTVYADDADYARALVTGALGQALMHPAFAGRSLTIDADVMYLWTADESSWDEARVRLELLSVLISRIPLAVWEHYDRTARVVTPTPAVFADAFDGGFAQAPDAGFAQAPGMGIAHAADAVWVPGEAEQETEQWSYVALEPEPAGAAPGVAVPGVAVPGAAIPGAAIPGAAIPAGVAQAAPNAPAFDGAFLPGATSPDSEYLDFAVAPILHP